MTPEELADRLEKAADDLGPALYKGVKHAGALGVGLIKHNASGRPGPNVRSAVNNYRDSWKSVPSPLPNGGMTTLGTKKPQGRRLEFGFMKMTDSIGRYYEQPPFPHVGPAIDAIGSSLRAAALRAVAEVLE